jgi:hypothetical protein
VVSITPKPLHSWQEVSAGWEETRWTQESAHVGKKRHSCRAGDQKRLKYQRFMKLISLCIKDVKYPGYRRVSLHNELCLIFYRKLYTYVLLTGVV